MAREGVACVEGLLYCIVGKEAIHDNQSPGPANPSGEQKKLDHMGVGDCSGFKCEQGHVMLGALMKLYNTYIG